MRDRLTDFADTTIAVVTFSAHGDLGAHRSHLDLPFPLLADPDRDLYLRFDLGRGALHQIWRPATLKLYAQLVARGHRLRKPTSDTRQLGGDFVIGSDGRLAAGFWPVAPDDRPTVNELLAAVRGA